MGLKLCNKAFESGSVPENRKNKAIVLLYKRKGEKREYKNYRDISLPSVVGKMNRRILIKRVRRITYGMIGEKQGNFRRSCVDQVFVLRQVTKKTHVKRDASCICIYI